MRLVSRLSSVLAATALVGTSLTLAVPAIAVGEPVGEEPTISTQVAEDSTPAEAPEVVSPIEDVDEVTEDLAPENEDVADTAQRDAEDDPDIAGTDADEEVSTTTELTLLNINDFHGRVDGTLTGDDNALKQGEWAKDKDGNPTTTWTPGSTTVNFAYTVDTLRNEAPYNNSLFLSAGDNVGASLFPSALSKDTPTLDILNALGLAASAVGNHEFDAGWADLRDRLTAEFDGVWLGANVYKQGTTTPVLPEYAMLEAAGLKVAVIGVVTQDTPTLVNPDNVAGLTFGDPVDAVNRVANKLNSMPAKYRPDIIVAEYHEGAAAVGASTTLAEKIADGGVFARIVLDTDASVDAIFNGHTHQEYTWDGPVPGDTDATRPIVSTGQYAANVGKVVLSVDTATDEVVDYTMALVNVAQFTKAKTIDEMVAGNPTVQAVYDITLEAVQNAKIEGSVPVAKMAQTISRDYTKGKYVDGKWQMDASVNNRDNESPMGVLVGNMLRDGQMSQLPDLAPDFGVTNPGGLRTDFTYTDGNKGIITVADARAVLPFNNNLSVAKMTGKQIVTMLEQQWQRDANNDIPSRAYLQLGLSDNISYTYHEVNDPDHDGAKLGVVDSVTLNGEALVMDQVYNVGTFEFLAAGGDNFWVFQDADIQDTGLVDWESWLDYLSATSGMEMGVGGPEFTSPIEPQFTRQGVAVEGMPAGGLVAGEKVTLTFRNMNVHAVGAPENTSLELKLAGVAVGTAEVTNERVEEDGDWTDWATVTFTVPAGFDGRGDLVATASPTGTQIVVPAATESPVVPEPSVRRAAGANRYLTNLAVNRLDPAPAGGIVIIATGADFADSLSASPAAALRGGSLFLTSKSGLTKAQLDEIKALDPSRVYIVGGTGAVPSSVAKQLTNATGMFPIRVAGADRYETSAKIFQVFFSTADVDRAFIATGKKFPDALSAAAVAGAMDAPVLLVDGTKGTNLMAPTLKLLKQKDVKDVVIAGGSGAVNSTIEKNLKKSFTVVRASGADRYQTNLALNNYANQEFGVGSIEGIWIATGTNFPDALSAAPKAGSSTQRLVLSNSKCIMKPVVSEWIMGASSNVEWTTLVGGTGVLPKALEKLPECK